MVCGAAVSRAEKETTLMLPLLVGMGLPLFAVIGYALLSPSPAGADGTYRDPRS
jgi:hypothetical protein